MSSIYLNPQPSSSPLPFQDFNGDHQLLGQIHDLASSSTSLSYTNFDMIHSYEESLALEYSRHPQEIKVNNILSLEKPNNIGHMLQSSSSSWPQNLVQDSSSGSSSYGYSSNNHDGRNKMEHVANNSDQIKLSRRSWKPSKVRIMQKMMANSNKDNIGEQKLHLDLKQQQGNITKVGNNNEGNNGIRVCSDCHTTTTPLWRSGPLGPKSLCNACGIRQRKARRAAMAAAAAAAAASSGLSNDGIATPMCVEQPKSEPRDQEVYKSTLDNKNTHPLPHKKRGKIVNASKNYFGNNSYNNNNNNNNGLTTSSKDYITTTSQRVFPRDEEEGAILLMALSCGLACSS